MSRTTLIEMRFGSHLYGTSTPQSDLDLKRVHLPTSEEILLGNGRSSFNVNTKVDRRQKNRDHSVGGAALFTDAAASWLSRERWPVFLAGATGTEAGLVLF